MCALVTRAATSAGLEATSSTDFEQFKAGLTADTDLVVLHAWRPPAAYADALKNRMQEERFEESTTRFLAEATAGTRADNPDVQVGIEARYQATTQALADLASRAGLVVVGRHQTSVGFLPLLGRVPRAAITVGLCPVMVVPLDAVEVTSD